MNLQKNSIHIKLNSKIIESIDDVFIKYPEKYNNRSHFVRCAIIKLVRDEKIGSN